MLNSFSTDSSSSSQPPLHILHLEDDAKDAELIARMLDRGGIRCLITRVDNEEAYARALDQGGIDLILSDSGVPGFSGMTALSRARALPVRVPFVVVSGNTNPDLRAKSLEMGATECFSKDHHAELLFLTQSLWQKKADGHAAE